MRFAVRDITVDITRGRQAGTAGLEDISPVQFARLMELASKGKENQTMEFPGFEQLGPLSIWAARMLATYIGRSGKKLSDEINDRATKAVADKLCAKAGSTWTWLKDKLGDRDSAEKRLKEFEEEPGDRTDTLALLLEQRMEDDEEFRREFQSKLEELVELQKRLPPRSENRSQIAIADRGGIVIQQSGDANQSRVDR